MALSTSACGVGVRWKKKKVTNEAGDGHRVSTDGHRCRLFHTKLKPLQ